MQLSAVLIPGLFWVLRYAPVPPENKPLKSRRDYWTRKLYAGFIYTGIIGLFYFTNMERWKLAVATGVIWQAFTLTHAGHRVINFGEW